VSSDHLQLMQSKGVGQQCCIAGGLACLAHSNLRGKDHAAERSRKVLRLHGSPIQIIRGPGQSA
jgi:hypothetical protein